MAFNNLSASQLVSFLEASTSGFSLNNGHTHVATGTDANKCMTKAQAFSKYNLVSNINTDSVSGHQLLQKSFWQMSQVVYFTKYLFRDIISGTSATCSTVSGNIQAIYVATNEIIIGTVIYSNPELTAVFNGEGFAFLSYPSKDSLITVGTNGIVSSVTACTQNTNVSVPNYVNTGNYLFAISGQQLILTYPSNIQSGDYLLLSLSALNTYTITPPVGYALLHDFTYDIFTYVTYGVYFKIANGTESGTSLAIPLQDGFTSGVISLLRGVSAKVASYATPNNNLNITISPSDSTPVAGVIAVYVFISASYRMSSITSTNENYINSHYSVNTVREGSFSIGTKQYPTAGTLPVAASVSITENKDSVGFLLYLQGSTRSILDINPPSTPQNLLSFVASPTEINIYWEESIDNVSVFYYEVYRSSTGGVADFVLLNNTVTASYLDSTVFPNTTYWYKVIAYDEAGNNSAFSEVISEYTFNSDNTNN